VNIVNSDWGSSGVSRPTVRPGREYGVRVAGAATASDGAASPPDLDLGLLALLEPSTHTVRIDDPRFCVCGRMTPCGNEPAAVFLGTGAMVEYRMLRRKVTQPVPAVPVGTPPVAARRYRSVPRPQRPTPAAFAALLLGFSADDRQPVTGRAPQQALAYVDARIDEHGSDGGWCAASCRRSPYGYSETFPCPARCFFEAVRGHLHACCGVESAVAR
jgi:hypothetical protein